MQSFLLGFLLLLATSALAQTDYYQKEQSKPARRQYLITLQDGSQLRGELIRQDSLEAVIKTSNLGQVVINASQITSMVAVDADKSTTSSGGYPNLFPQYLNFTPTAYQAERGKLYYRNSILYFSQFDYGINDNWSVGAGFFTFVPTALFSLNTKVSFPVSKTVRLGIQGQYINGTGLLDVLNNGLGYVQGIASFGTSQRNITVGLGAVFNRGKLADGKVLTVGIVRKMTPSLTFISENHVFIGPDAGTNLTVSGGVRFDRRRHSFDVSVLLPFINDSGSTFFIFPNASYQIRIGR